jgi:hypothetical protein
VLTVLNDDVVQQGEDSTDGIWVPYQAFYIQSMLFSTRSAFQSAKALHSLVNQISQKAGQGEALSFDCSAALDHVQNIVLRAAAISRFFWPVRKGHERRAAHLKVALGISEDSPLHNRDLRNSIEHLDERLDFYLKNGIVGQIFPEWFGPTRDSKGVPTHYFRAFFIDTGTFKILDTSFVLQPVVDELMRIHYALEEFDEKGGVFSQST